VIRFECRFDGMQNRRQVAIDIQKGV